MAPGGRNRRANTNVEVPSLHEVHSHSSGSKRNVQKRATNNKLADYIAKGGPRPRIEIIAPLKVPLGPWAKEWVTELGIITRKHVPLIYHYWKDVPGPKKAFLFERVLDSFDVDFTQAHVAKSVQDHMKKMFKEYRCELHTYYMSLPDDIDKAQHPRNDVGQADWVQLCVWWEDPKFKNRSQSNKRSRDGNKTGHRGGARCFARAMHEYVDPQSNGKPDAITFYKLTHYSSEKGWVSSHAEENYVKMVEMRMEPTEEDSTPLTADAIREKVLGARSSYVPGLGYGVVAPTRTVGYGSGEDVAAATVEINQLRTRAENAENELQELKVQYEQIRNQHEQMRNQHEQVREQQNAQQHQLNYLMSVFRGIPTSMPSNFSEMPSSSIPNSFSAMLGGVATLVPNGFSAMLGGS